MNHNQNVFLPVRAAGVFSAQPATEIGPFFCWFQPGEVEMHDGQPATQFPSPLCFR